MAEQKESEGGKKVFSWKCEKCGKEIISLYPQQFAFNKALHKDACNKKDKTSRIDG